VRFAYFEHINYYYYFERLGFVMEKDVNGKVAEIGRMPLMCRIGKFLDKYFLVLFAAVCCGIALGGVAFATGDALWDTIAGLIGTWVARLGGVVIFVGGVMFGLGWKNDDAEGKSRGVNTIIAGAIVTAMSLLVGTFFA
jgi:hypothetical protein